MPFNFSVPNRIGFDAGTARPKTARPVPPVTPAKTPFVNPDERIDLSPELIHTPNPGVDPKSVVISSGTGVKPTTETTTTTTTDTGTTTPKPPVITGTPSVGTDQRRPAPQPQMTNEQFGSAVVNVSNSINEIMQMARNDGGVAALIALSLNNLMATLQATEERVIGQLQQQGQDDPALQAALGLIREEIDLQRQSLLEDMNARGLAQSGVMLEMETRLNRNALSQQQQMIAQRMGQLQTQLTDAIMQFSNQRLGIMSQFSQMGIENAGRQQDRLIDTAQWGTQQLAQAHEADRAQNRWSSEFEMNNYFRNAQLEIERQAQALQERALMLQHERDQADLELRRSGQAWQQGFQESQQAQNISAQTWQQRQEADRFRAEQDQQSWARGQTENQFTANQANANRQFALQGQDNALQQTQFNWQQSMQQSQNLSNVISSVIGMVVPDPATGKPLITVDQARAMINNNHLLTPADRQAVLNMLNTFSPPVTPAATTPAPTTPAPTVPQTANPNIRRATGRVPNNRR